MIDRFLIHKAHGACIDHDGLFVLMLIMFLVKVVLMLICFCCQSNKKKGCLLNLVSLGLFGVSFEHQNVESREPVQLQILFKVSLVADLWSILKKGNAQKLHKHPQFLSVNLIA